MVRHARAHKSEDGLWQGARVWRLRRQQAPRPRSRPVRGELALAAEGSGQWRQGKPAKLKWRSSGLLGRLAPVRVLPPARDQWAVASGQWPVASGGHGLSANWQLRTDHSHAGVA